MEFIQHTNNWIKGEIFEAIIIGVFGLLVITTGILYWKFGHTLNTKALIIPLVIVGVVLMGMGISMYFSNQKRLLEYKSAFEQNKAEFVQNEKERVESFQYMYTTTKVLATIFFVFAILVFWFSKSPNLHGIAIGLALFGLSGLVIDYFSQERADHYYEKINTEIKILK